MSSTTSTAAQSPCYGASPISLVELQKAFVDFRFGNTASERTKGVQKRLQKLKEERSSIARFFGNSCEAPEFLVDYVLYVQEDVKTSCSGAIALAVESEQSDKSTNGACWDFDKLLHIKAPLKFFIYASDVWQAAKEEVEHYLRDYEQHVRGEQILFLLKDGDNTKFFKFECKEDGKQNSKLELSEI